MREQPQLRVEPEVGGGSLRRCAGCGVSARPAKTAAPSGTALCERCAEKMLRDRREGGPESDPTEVNFLI